MKKEMGGRQMARGKSSIAYRGVEKMKGGSLNREGSGEMADQKN